MIVDRLIVGHMKVNCYFCINEKTNTGFIVDPGDDDAKICKHIEENGYNITHIILTHGHFDHIMALKKVKDFTGGKIVIHKNDAPLLEDDNLNLLRYVARIKRDYVKEDIIVREETLKTSDFEIEFINTPGHTDGSMCILCGDIMFSGDMLFKGSIGRTDFKPYGDTKKMADSIRRLKEINKDYKVYPGHGEETTLREEIRSNPYFNENIWN
ncbi:MAG: MBL fold metallo-hydrolase [Clostridia bacterium]|nr:MBL fold metallo-hydrolase [Clostridia bacterium]